MLNLMPQSMLWIGRFCDRELYMGYAICVNVFEKLALRMRTSLIMRTAQYSALSVQTYRLSGWRGETCALIKAQPRHGDISDR
jgi:hypothetical protein